MADVVKIFEVMEKRLARIEDGNDRSHKALERKVDKLLEVNEQRLQRLESDNTYNTIFRKVSIWVICAFATAAAATAVAKAAGF